MNSIPFPGAEIPFEGGINFRELGGYRVKDGRTVYGVAREVGAFVLQSIRSSFGSYEAYLEAEYGLDAARLNALRDKYLISGIPD